MKAKCKDCGKKFVMGETGIVEERKWLFGFTRPVPVCDDCAQVHRTPEGYAMTPDEQVNGMYLEDVKTGEIEFIPPIQ